MQRDGSTLKAWHSCQTINTLRPRQNGRHFADDIFKCIFLNENIWIPVKISLKFAPQGPINNIPALVQIMAWRRPSHYLNQWWLDYRRIYAPLGINELKMFYTKMMYLSPLYRQLCLQLRVPYAPALNTIRSLSLSLTTLLENKNTGCLYKMLYFCPPWRGLCNFPWWQRAYPLFCGPLRVWHWCKPNNSIGHIGLSKATVFWYRIFALSQWCQDPCIFRFVTVHLKVISQCL